jgi:hypothetical protein
LVTSNINNNNKVQSPSLLYVYLRPQTEASDYQAEQDYQIMFHNITLNSQDLLTMNIITKPKGKTDGYFRKPCRGIS